MKYFKKPDEPEKCGLVKSIWESIVTEHWFRSDEDWYIIENNKSTGICYGCRVSRGGAVQHEWAYCDMARDGGEPSGRQIDRSWEPRKVRDVAAIMQGFKSV